MKIDAITKSVAEAVGKIVDEGLKGDQHKIDANKNKKIDAQDFKILRAKKEVKEDSAIEEANAPSVKVPVKGGMRVYGGAPGGSAKAYKDQHADPFSSVRGPSDTELKDVESEKKKVKKEETGYKNRLLALVAENQAFEQELNEVLSKDASAAAWIHDFVHSDNPKFKGKTTKQRQKMALGAYYAKQRNEEVESVSEMDYGGGKNHYAGHGLSRDDDDAGKKEYTTKPTTVKKVSKDALSILNKQLTKKDVKEEVEIQESHEEIKVHSKDGKHIGTITHGKYQSVAYAHPTTKFGGSKEPADDEDSMTLKGHHDTQSGIDFIHAHHRMMSEGKDPAMDSGAGSEPPFAPPYNTSSSPAIKDKSGAVHTPMSRAKHLARTAMKKISKDLSNK